MSVNIDTIVNKKLYVGTLKNKANPKTRDYWAGSKNGLIVLNPETTAQQIESAKQKILEVKKSKKEILILCEKSVYKDELEVLAKESGINYMNYKVPGGVLTNFDTVLSRIKSMNDLREYVESEDFEKLTKKEKLIKMRQLRKLEKVYKGVKSLKKLPQLVLIIDGMQMMKYVQEVEKLKIDNVVFVNSDFNRWWDEESLVMCNLNSYEALDFLLKYILI